MSLTLIREIITVAKKSTSEASLFTADEFKKTFKKNTKIKESSIQVQVCKHLKDNYPDVIFQCDLASGMNLGKHIGGMNARLRSSRGLPDLFIAHWRSRLKSLGSDKYENYNGLFIELKRDGKSPYLKDGSLSKNEHVQEQAAILKRLEEQGYKAVFAVGAEEAIKIIDEYLS